MSMPRVTSVARPSKTPITPNHETTEIGNKGQALNAPEDHGKERLTKGDQTVLQKDQGGGVERLTNNVDTKPKSLHQDPVFADNEIDFDPVVKWVVSEVAVWGD
ncbi:hypothetical protein I7I51_03140 [Histoplasma capsulatum]|uniref:Uncharacterized protein n=1 Tax=Ajellomyces capsulatus TaxID=5037 RepID=A0A8A1MK08_AJECA|nr:predicted protein [Histoplasma mississippiense (nom. inval.)]EDN11142.1 predicted protein [Histoplasma mississippiense (nom. inval.)]QSS66928.1 hypothetical protein I7I51_03140 [Histoplasma capsulatum]